MGHLVGERDQSSVPQSILHFIHVLVSPHVVPCSVSQMCSPALCAVEARHMGMSLLGSRVLQCQAGSWSTDFNIKILVCIPVVACTASLVVWGCRFKTLADWHILNSEFCSSDTSDVVIHMLCPPMPLLKMKAKHPFYFEATLRADRFQLSIMKLP